MFVKQGDFGTKYRPKRMWRFLLNILLLKALFQSAYSSGHLVLSHSGLAFVLMLRPFFPELVMSTDLLSFEIPRHFYFAFKGLF